jgi:hypothetical protein
MASARVRQQPFGERWFASGFLITGYGIKWGRKSSLASILLRFAPIGITRQQPSFLKMDLSFTGYGFGAATTNVGEICFNTSMTGYQEILTDPSYAGQIITFTFPHIGNVGANDQDFETITPSALGLIVRQAVTNPASWRATSDLDSWLKTHNLPGISGIDTRALTRRIRDLGAPRGALCYAPDGNIDVDALKAQAVAWPGLKNMDLAVDVTCDNPHDWHQGSWQMDKSAHLETHPNIKLWPWILAANTIFCAALKTPAVRFMLCQLTPQLTKLWLCNQTGCFYQMARVIQLQPPLMLARRLPS